MPSRFSALFLIALFLASCDDTTEHNRATVVGRWELTKAMRNQRETGVLAGIFFDFGADGKMLTNLPVTPEPMATEYEVKKSELIQQLPSPITYHIEALSDSILVLGLEMRGIPFQLQLRKVQGSVLPEAPVSQDSLSGLAPDTLE